MIRRRTYLKRTPLRRSTKRLRARRPKASRVLPDGREILQGEDYRLRRFEVWVRDEGKCVLCGRPVNFEESEIDHKQKRKIRDDRPANLRTVCGGDFGCHAARHNSERALAWSKIPVWKVEV